MSDVIPENVIAEPALSSGSPAAASTAPSATWLRLPRSQFIRKVAETYLARLLVVLIGGVTTILVARMLGPDGRGVFAVAIALGALGVQFGTLGLHTSNTYFVARNPGLLAQLLGNTLLVSLGFGGVGALAAWLFFALYPSVAPVDGIVLALALAWIPFGLAYTLMQLLMLGVHQIRLYNVVEVAHRMLALALIAGMAWTGWISPAAFVGAVLVAVMMAAFWAGRRLRALSATSPSTSLALFRQTIGYGMKAYLAGFFTFLVLRADLLMVQYMLGAEHTGHYSIAVVMADYLGLLSAVVAAILFPKLSALSDIKLKLALMRKAAIGTAALMLPLLLGGVLLARPLVELLFGAAFLPSASALIWLAPGMFFLGIQTVVAQFLNSIGFPVGIVLVWGACSALNILANLWAIPVYGIVGAAAVSSACYLLALVLMAGLIYRTTTMLSREPAELS